MAKFNVSYMRREAERIIALGKEGPIEDIQYDDLPIIMAYIALGQVAYIEAPDSVASVMVRAKADLGRFPPGATWPRGRIYSLLQAVDYKRVSLSEVRSTLLPFDPTRYAGVPLPPIKAQYWFPKAPEAWPPGRGRPSLIVYGGFLSGNCLREDGSVFRMPLRHECIALRTTIPQWIQHYQGRLAITLVAQTQGSALRSQVLSPAAEADSIAWYVHNRLRLPVTVGVVEELIQRMPASDGREFHTDTTYYGRTYPSGVVIFYDADGRLLYVGSSFKHPMLRRLVEREMRAVSSRSFPSESPSP
jgi:hypothetical protein